MSQFTVKITPAQGEKLLAHLKEREFDFFQPPYTVFQAKKPGLTLTLYTSGKLTIGGKDKDEFIEFYLEPEITGVQMLMKARIGVDESGKGDFFGPLCIAAVYADEHTLLELKKLGVKDSKAMRDPQILKLAKIIRSKCASNVVQIFPKKYNELYTSFKNLNSLLAWGHATAIEQVAKETGCKEVIVDQFAKEHVVENALEKKSIEVHLTQRHRGEEELIVAAASIIARACFVDGMNKLSERFGIKLPLGANAGVIAAGKQFVAKHGKDTLEEVAKLHFKTTQQVL